MTSYFDSWGTKENPVRASDLNSLFGSLFRCPKRWALSKLKPRQSSRVNHKLAMGEIAHDLIARGFNFQDLSRLPMLTDALEEYEKENGCKIDFESNREKIIQRYDSMLAYFFDSPNIRSIKTRMIDAERSFMLKIGKFWVAGTIDAIFKGKEEGKTIAVDWKTGNPVSQWEMDNGYQSNIYALAVEKAEFFLKPEKMESGHDYYKSWKNTKQRNQYNIYPSFYFVHLPELIPASRKSKRKSRHYSTQAMSDPDDMIRVEKGGKRGPVFYEARPSHKNITRLSYTLACAVAFAKIGTFPEVLSSRCETCTYQDDCREMGIENLDTDKAVAALEELGIEPD